MLHSWLVKVFFKALTISEQTSFSPNTCLFIYTSTLFNLVPKVDIYLISEFKVRIRLDQIPVAKAVLINTKQELNVILQVPVDIKVGYLDPARQIEPAGNRDSPFLICCTDALSTHLILNTTLSLGSLLHQQWDLTYFSRQGWRALLCAEAQTLPHAGWWTWRWPALPRSWCWFLAVSQDLWLEY